MGSPPPSSTRTVLVIGPEATERLGELLGRHLESGQVLALRGELGAGKTCLARGVARGLEIDAPDDVCSPTYLLVIEHPGKVPLLHVDAYLPDKTRAFLEDGGAAYLAEAGGVAVVEWAEHIEDLLPAEVLWAELEPVAVGGAEARRVCLRDECGRFAWIGSLPERLV